MIRSTWKLTVSSSTLPALLRTLALCLFWLGVLLWATSCTTTPPRAIMPPPADVSRIETKGIEKATSATKTAVREIAKAGVGTRAAAQNLTSEIDRAVATATAENAAAFASIKRLNAELNHALKFAETKELIATSTIDSLETELSGVKAQALAQAAQIEANDKERQALREQVKALSTTSDKLAIAEDKLHWWRWAGTITWIIVALYIAARVYLKAIIPIRF